MPAFPLHGWMPDGYRDMPLPVLAVFSGVLSQGRRLRLPADRAAAVPRRDRALPDADAAHRARLDPLRLGDGVHDDRRAARSSATRRSPSSASSCSGSSRCDDEGAQGALLQAVNHGLVVAPAFFIVALLAARAGGSEDIRDMGGLAFRAPVLAALFLIVALATLAMPGSSNFVGEFLILLGVFKAKIVDRDRRLRPASCWPRSTRCGCSSARCTTASGPRVESREMTLRDGLVLVPLVLAILALALYPQFALEQAASDVDGRRRAVSATAGDAPIRARRRR